MRPVWTSKGERIVTEKEPPGLEALAARLRASGFDPSPSSLAELHAALPHLERLRARLRRAYTYADEPAHVFNAAETNR